MMRLIRILLCLALPAFTTIAAGPANKKFTGVITDSMCAKADHSQMRMGSNDTECAVACVLAHGAQYVLFDGTHAYTLSDQQMPEKFAGKKVTVVGTLDAKTSALKVVSINPAK